MGNLHEGDMLVDNRTGDKYIYVSSDLLSDTIHISNWFGDKHISAEEFYAHFDLYLPTGTENKSLSLDKDLCDHEFTEYQGLREAFKYCKKCDKRA